MTRFWRNGHWRYRNGQSEYVSGHWVDRDDWYRGSWVYDPEWVSFSSGRSWPRSYLDQNEPNATCPMCDEPVWFFRNENGGCAYFDDVGKPWPKHPCMNSHLLGDRTADWQARVAYRVAYEEDEDHLFVRDARNACNEWALALLNAHTLELDVRKTAAQVKRAVTTTQQSASRPETRRRRRERVRSLRQRLRELRFELRKAQAAVADSQRHYEDELDYLD